VLASLVRQLQGGGNGMNLGMMSLLAFSDPCVLLQYASRTSRLVTVQPSQAASQPGPDLLQLCIACNLEASKQRNHLKNLA
jgi:hypothetical protein